MYLPILPANRCEQSLRGPLRAGGGTKRRLPSPHTTPYNPRCRLLQDVIGRVFPVRQSPALLDQSGVHPGGVDQTHGEEP